MKVTAKYGRTVTYSMEYIWTSIPKEKFATVLQPRNDELGEVIE